MKLQFIGAAHEVTGSCHYLEACGRHILVDYGMEQGVNLFENAPLPVEAPLIDYVLLVKSNYKSHWGDQEFLDRQDEYNMTFFLDESGNWISSSIIVNSWRVVLNNQVIK